MTPGTDAERGPGPTPSARLDAILAQGRPTLSCEFFPPKSDRGEANLWQALARLQAIAPDFVSVTYGAGGSTQARTRRIVRRIRRETSLPPVAHLTCVGATRRELTALLDGYRADGIDNILALRGDPPEGMARFEAVAGGFAHASDLVSFITARGDFSVAVATYPEGHPESPGGMMDDVRYLKLKQECGAVAAITQYFFDNEAFYRFRDAAAAAGVTIPIIPGIMPIADYHRIVGFSAMCGASIPTWLAARMEPIAGDSEAVRAAGVELAVAQCADLLAHGAPGLHFYCLNRAEMTLEIVRALPGVRPRPTAQ
ncbi:MAG: methylenetetrahydrofolate reductase [NAD(P)H] [Zetaproteobacteria bacterium]|nr:MAG: methylenetetrahydrofolate reductase [NAD(P)H] [Zetaproteobacteria bacterium]